MNIFYLDHDIVKCAEYHNNKHVVKMVLEYAQLLSTAHRILDGVPTVLQRETTGRKYTRYSLSNHLDGMLYSATHVNHPSAVWVRQSKSNYIWLSNLLIQLCSEYTHRYSKTHKIERDGLCYVLLKNIPNNISDNEFTEPTPAMPDACKIANDSVASYRNYYINNKTHLASWKNRDIPKWFQEGCLSEIANDAQKMELYDANLHVSQ